MGLLSRVGKEYAESMADLFKVKPPQKLYRGIAKGAQQSGADGIGIATLGRGLYTSPSKAFASRFAGPAGDLIEVPIEEAWPRNPLVLPNGMGDATSVFIDWALRESGAPNLRVFNRMYPDPADFVKSRGFDGVVAGDEIVYYGAQK